MHRQLLVLKLQSLVAYIAASWLLEEMAGKDLTIYNRGISVSRY